MTVDMMGIKAITAVVVATVGAGIDMVGAELLFAIETRFGGSDVAHGTERQRGCGGKRVGER